MKNKKGRFAEELSDGALELILTFLCFGIGALVIGMFGVNFENVDADLLTLLGLAALFLIGGAIVALVKFIRKKRK